MSTPLNPNSPARTAPRSKPSASAVPVEATSPRSAAKPSQADVHHRATRISRPVTGLFMKTTWPTPRRP
ncbi:hypothetical protein BJF79_21180 [Actinomadura sp. CNU-125]|nr:hypothetical protein BJF79_21180 [Actinomadura sp. CNU-125]